MFKALFSEVRRSLRRNNTTDQQSLTGNRYEALIEDFRASDRATRLVLVGELQASLIKTSGDGPGWTLLGDWLLQLGNARESESAYRQALQLQATNTRAQEGLGLSLLQQGQLEEAYLRLEAASKSDPMNAEIWTHWGLVDLELGNLGRASEKFQRAIERDPQNPHAWHNLGLTAYKQGNAAATVELLRRTLEIKPDHGLAFSNLALALRRVEKLDEALTAAQRATELKLGNARVWVVLADIQISAGQHDNAATSIAEAQRIDPKDVSSFVALGKLQAHVGALGLARQAYETALQLQPNHADAQGGLAELLLSQSEWTPAWDLYEARRRVDPTPVRNFPYLEWQGDELSGHRVLVHAEQGMGDIIMFGSCLGDLQARGARCILEVPPRLHALFARSFPEVQVVAHAIDERDLSWLNTLPAIDLHAPLGSLPRWTRRNRADFPTRNAYLRPDPAQVAAWRERLASHGRPTVGIAWRGGLAITSKQQRSLAVEDLVRALAPVDAQLVCLQYGDVADDLARVQRDLGVDIDPGLSGYTDFDALAALTAACDAVVTVCSSQAHLTGALGQPGLVLVPRHPNWRYGADGTQMPWYPSLRLARQREPGQWDSVLHEACSWAGTVLRERADATTVRASH